MTKDKPLTQNFPPSKKTHTYTHTHTYTGNDVTTGLKWMLGFTPKLLLTPMLIFVALLSHTAADAGYVLVIPLGGVIFYAAGRHPIAGIAAAFAGVSGGFSANFVPSFGQC